MAERKVCGIEFAPGIACNREAGHKLPEYPDLDRGQYNIRSTVIWDVPDKHRFEWLEEVPSPEASTLNLRAVVIRFLQLPMTERVSILEGLGIAGYARYGGASLALVRERGLIPEFTDAVAQRTNVRP